MDEWIIGKNITTIDGLLYLLDRLDGSPCGERFVIDYDREKKGYVAYFEDKY